jgi:hypothetical protein
MPHEGHGVLIHSQWVVTVAHAIFYDYVGKELLIGDNAYQIESVHIHPDYTEPNKSLFKGDLAPLMSFFKSRSDIALIKLATTVSNVNPIKIYQVVFEPVDVFGGVIFSLFLVFLVVAIVQGPAWGWGSLLSVLFFIVAAVALVAFASQEWRLKTPIIDLKLLRDRFYRSSIYASIALATAFYGGFFIMPFYLHLLLDMPVDAVGFILLAVTIVTVAVQPLVKRLTDFANLKLLILLGLAFLIVSVAIQAQFIVMDDLEVVLFAFVLMGFGIGIIWGTSRKVIFRLFKPENNHLVTETLWSWQTASAAVGLAIMGSIFRQRLFANSRESL